MKIEDVAKICHEANKALCETLGDFSQSGWDAAPDWQKTSAINNIKFHLDNPDATPENSHENWLALKEVEGWKYGAVKNSETKEHPSFMPYEQLSPEEQAKDYLFCAIVNGLSKFVKR